MGRGKRSTRGKAVRVRYVTEKHEEKNNDLRQKRHKKRLNKLMTEAEERRKNYLAIQEYLYEKTREKRSIKQIKKDFKKNNTDFKEFLSKIKNNEKV